MDGFKEAKAKGNKCPLLLCSETIRITKIETPNFYRKRCRKHYFIQKLHESGSQIVAFRLCLCCHIYNVSPHFNQAETLTVQQAGRDAYQAILMHISRWFPDSLCYLYTAEFVGRHRCDIQDHHLTRKFNNRPDKSSLELPSNNVLYLHVSLTFQLPFAPFSILTHLTPGSLLEGSAATIVEYAPGDPWWHCHLLEGWSPVELGRVSFLQISPDYDVNYNR